MSLSLIEPKAAGVLWLSVSPSLKFFDQPLLQYLRTSCPIAYWEYHQNQDEPSDLETALAFLCQAQQLHRIPCHNCRFYSGDPHLKCTVHPYQALTEAAIDCPDFKG